MKRLVVFSLVALSVGYTLTAQGARKRSHGFPTAVAHYTYDQAVAAGILPSPAQMLQLYKLPFCKPTPWDGFSTPAAAQAAIAAAPEEPTCQADPSTITEVDVIPAGLANSDNGATMGVSKLAGAKRTSTSGYEPYYYSGVDGLNYMGNNPSTQPRQGSSATCEDTDPTVNDISNPPFGQAEHVVCTAGVVWPANASSISWNEIGWAEGWVDSHQTGNTQKVFTEENENGTIIAQWYNYSLSVGSYYPWRARDYWNGSVHQLISDIYWSGQKKTPGDPPSADPTPAILDCSGPTGGC